MAVINATAADFIPFAEGKSSAPNPSHSLDAITFFEIARCSTPLATVNEQLVVGDSPHFKDFELAASDTLSFFEQGLRGATAFATDLIGFIDFGGLYYGGPGVDSLSLTEASTSETAKPIYESLGLTESAENRLNPLLINSDTFEIYEFAIGVKDTCLAVDQRLQLQLMYPADAPITTITLCVPNMGDIRRRDFQRINRRSRGNDLIVYRDPAWVVSDHFTLLVDKLNAAQKQNLINFLEYTTGLYIRMRDYEGNIWKGFITNPNVPITQIGSCRYSCELQFSGGVIQNGSTL
jgi:hypothetical protein